MQSTALIAAIAAAGCASSQINYNTLEIASTYDQLLTKQVTFNLLKQINDPYGLPAFVKVTNQTATTQNSITPTISFPFTSQIAKVSQLSAAQAPTSLTTTSLASRTSTLAGEGLNLSAMDGWNQTYTLTPVTDSGELRRLRVIYQYVTGALTPKDCPEPHPEDAQKCVAKWADILFEVTYPLIETSGDATGSSNQSPNTNIWVNLNISVDGHNVTAKSSGSSNNVQDAQAKPPGSTVGNSNKTYYVRRAVVEERPCEIDSQNPPADQTPNLTSWTLISPDTTFTKMPGCVLCETDIPLSKGEKDAVLLTLQKCNPELTERDPTFQKYLTARKLVKNPKLTNDWLLKPGPGEPLPTEARPLPSNGAPLLYARTKEKMADFYELVLFSLDAASQGTGSAASGGQSEGRKNPAATTGPVGGPVPSLR
jgi:hypothetical protein